MDWQCPHCGSTMFLRAIAGYFTLICPREHDGNHPVFVTYTSDGTSAPIPRELEVKR